MSEITQIVQSAKDTVVTKADALFKAVVNLLNDADFKSVFSIASAHNYAYKGPDFSKELNELNDALKALESAKTNAENNTKSVEAKAETVVTEIVDEAKAVEAKVVKFIKDI